MESKIFFIVSGLLLLIPAIYMTQESYFTQTRSHSKLQTTNSEFNVLSSVNCASLCSSSSFCTGFNFFKSGNSNLEKKCEFLTTYDLNNGVLTSVADFFLYIKETYVNIFEQAQVCYFLYMNFETLLNRGSNHPSQLFIHHMTSLLFSG